MADLDALRALKWAVWGPELVEALDAEHDQTLWYLHALHGTPTDAVVRVEHRDRATAQARLLAACGLPTERERALEEALRAIADLSGVKGEDGWIAFKRDPRAIARTAFTSTKEARGA